MASETDARLSADADPLVRRAIQGDADAFGELYTLHLDAIYRYIFFRVGHEAQAEDITEEVFVRAWEALPRYEPGQHPFTSWLYRIAHNLVVDHHRRPESVPVQPSDLEGLINGAAMPEERLASQQEMAAVAWAVQQLDDEAQQIILLRFVEGLSHREVAHVIGKSEGACRVIQHRALQELHRLLSEQEQD